MVFEPATSCLLTYHQIFWHSHALQSYTKGDEIIEFEIHLLPALHITFASALHLICYVHILSLLVSTLRSFQIFVETVSVWWNQVIYLIFRTETRLFDLIKKAGLVLI